MNERNRPLAEALTSRDSKVRALVMQIEALEPGAIERIAAMLRLDRVQLSKPN